MGEGLVTAQWGGGSGELGYLVRKTTATEWYVNLPRTALVLNSSVP